MDGKPDIVRRKAHSEAVCPVCFRKIAAGEPVYRNMENHRVYCGYCAFGGTRLRSYFKRDWGSDDLVVHIDLLARKGERGRAIILNSPRLMPDWSRPYGS